MTLLIKKDCQFCEEVKNIKHKDLKIFYVKDGIVEELGTPLPYPEMGLPRLITGTHVFIGSKYILDYFKSIGVNNE